MEEFKIERLGHQGDGIAHGPLFAPLTLPGEKITALRDGSRLTDIRIVTPSSDRVRPPCRHFKSCGGCQMMHGSDGFVADWKASIVTTALAAHGLETDVRATLTSPSATRRRAAFSVRRTKKGALAGFHGRASDVIVEIPDCQLIHPDLHTALEAGKALALIGGSRKAELSVTATRSLGGLDLAVTGGKPLDGPLLAVLAQECERAGIARLSWDGEVVAMRHAPEQAFGRGRVTPPPGAFLQATPEGEAALLASVRDIVSDAARGVDLFSGCGTFTLPLAETAEVHAVESEAAMLDALDGGWRQAQGLKKITTETRDLFRNPLLPDELKYDFTVLDPPRAGAEAQIRELATSDIPLVAYVSCNPVTFARDAVLLVAAGFSLNWVQVVDQFRWSSHVELAAKFSR